jgi:hypothetical protein
MIVFVGHKSGRKKMKQSGSDLSMFVIKQQSFVSSILYIGEQMVGHPDAVARISALRSPVIIHHVSSKETVCYVADINGGFIHQLQACPSPPKTKRS